MGAEDAFSTYSLSTSCPPLSLFLLVRSCLIWCAARECQNRQRCQERKRESAEVVANKKFASRQDSLPKDYIWQYFWTIWSSKGTGQDWWTVVDRVYQTFSKVKTALPKNDNITFWKNQNVCKISWVLMMAEREQSHHQNPTNFGTLPTIQRFDHDNHTWAQLFQRGGE